MLTCKPADAEQIEEFLNLLRMEAGDYLDRTAALMQMTWEQFSGLVNTVGQVWSVYRGGDRVGFYWIEERDGILHLHGLVVRSALQGQGIGTEVLNMLAQRYSGMVDAIELGVHESNARARALYERLGYQTVGCLDDLGFRIMRKPLVAE